MRGDTAVRVVAARRCLGAGGYMLLPPPDFSKRGERCQKRLWWNKRNETGPTLWKAELFLTCCFGAIAGDG